MGYHITLTSLDVRLKPGTDKLQVLAHLKAMMLTPEALRSKATGGQSPETGDVFEDKWYAWTSTKALLNAETLEEYLGEFLESAALDEDTLYFEYNSKMGNEDVLFEALAPFIVAGSHIDWQGEDGSLWRYKFDGTTMKAVDGFVYYSED